MMKVAFFDAKPYDKESFNAVNRDFGFQIKYFELHLTEDTAQLAQGYDVACCFVNDCVNAAVIQKLHASGVRLLALRCAGYNNVDLKAAYRKIDIVRVPNYSPYAVAEHALAMILSLNRKIHRAYNRTRDNNFSITGFLGFDLHGKTAGIVGLGKIGQVMSQILKGLGMRVIGYDIDIKTLETAGIEAVALEKLYAESDIISLHCPLTPQTRHLIGSKAFQKMKPGVMLINTGRGGLVDAQALIEALKIGKVGSAGLDVYEEESYFFYEDLSNSFISDDLLARLLSFPNVLITSHQAFFTREALHNIATTTLASIQEHAQGLPLSNRIDI